MKRNVRSQLSFGLLLTLVLILAACDRHGQPVRQPDPFVFEGVVGVEPATVVTSSEVTITGHNAPLPATVAGEGAVLIINGAVVAGTANVAPGDRISIRMPASGEFATTVTATASVGTTSASFLITTREAGTLPDEVTFISVTGAEPGATVDSNTVTLGGFDGSLEAAVSNGTLILNGEPIDGASAYVVSGDSIAVRVTAGAGFEEVVIAALDLGANHANFSVTTRAVLPPEVVQFEAGTAIARPAQPVLLAWLVVGDYDELELGFSSTTQDVYGFDDWLVTTPSSQPLANYTLTARHSSSGMSSSAQVDVSIPLWVCVNNDYPITFEDAELEANIRARTTLPDTGPIQCSDMQVLTSYGSSNFEGNAGSIVSLVGLQHATGLTELDLQYNEIADLTPIAGLTDLEIINFDKNHVVDLSPLSSLVNLREIGFWDNGPVFDEAIDGITDLGPLASLPNLEILYLSDNNISDLSPLAGLENIRVIYAFRNNLSDLSALANKASLRTVRVGFQRSNFSITDGSVFGTLPNLAWLEVQFSGVTDLAFLGALTGLHAIALDGMRLTSIDSLLGNTDFPDSTVDPAGLGVDAPLSPRLSVGFNCLPTDPGSPTATGIAALEAAGVTVLGYTPELQETCGSAGIGAAQDRLLLEIRNSGGYR